VAIYKLENVVHLFTPANTVLQIYGWLFFLHDMAMSQVYLWPRRPFAQFSAYNVEQ
jgi:hypothetical protein